MRIIPFEPKRNILILCPIRKLHKWFCHTGQNRIGFKRQKLVDDKVYQQIYIGGLVLAAASAQILKIINLVSYFAASSLFIKIENTCN